MCNLNRNHFYSNQLLLKLLFEPTFTKTFSAHNSRIVCTMHIGKMQTIKMITKIFMKNNFHFEVDEKIKEMKGEKKVEKVHL